MAVSWKWAAKATVQRAISLLPDPDAWNHRLQALTGRDEIDAAMVDNRIEMVAMHHSAMVQAGVADPSTGLAPGTRVVELGTGWHPVVPILVHLLGADEVVTVDHVDHGSDELLVATVRTVADAVTDGRVGASLPTVRSDRQAALVHLADQAVALSRSELLAELGITPVVADVRSPEAAAVGPVDAVVSNLVLEHIPADILGEVVAACFSLLRSGGVMSHVVDQCDHGHYVDPSLSQFNFLRFSDRAWRIVGNDIQHENRLRSSQLLEVVEAAGVPVTRATRRRGDWPDLARVPIAEPFCHLDRDDLLVVMTHVESVHP